MVMRPFVVPAVLAIGLASTACGARVVAAAHSPAASPAVSTICVTPPVEGLVESRPTTSGSGTGHPQPAVTTVLATSVPGCGAAPIRGSAIAGISSGPVTPGPIVTASLLQPESAPAPTPAPTPCVSGTAGTVAISGGVWNIPDSYVCVYPGTVFRVHVMEYPSGWDKPVVAPAGAAELTSWVAASDGSFDAIVQVGNAGSFTLTIDALNDHAAPSQEWTVHVGVVRRP